MSNQIIGDIKIGRVNQSLPNYISIRCDRKTPLGNPYWMSDESKRNEVCDKFEIYLNSAANTHKHSLLLHEVVHISMLVARGSNVLLQCWCAPKRCHCDSIKSFVLNLINKPE